MTFLKLVNDIKQKYATNNNVVIFEILFKTSKLIKSKIDFLTYRNKQIDFKSERIYKYLDAYFYKNKPLGQIVRHTKFCGIKIDIYKNIFEPRSETELITEKIIEYLKHNHKLINGVDLCCGTGCIGLAIKKHCTWVNITSIDINPKAVRNTIHNSKLNNLKIKTYIGDFYKTLIDKRLKFDFVVCNPPYIKQNKLDKTMIKYETNISFNNSSDSLYFYKLLIKNKKKFLNSGGKIFFENPNCKLLTI